MTEPAAPDVAKRARALAIAAAGLGALLLLLLVAWFAYGHGQRTAGGDPERRKALEGQVEWFERENARLNAQVAELEMARRLDREAYGEVERTLGDLQSKLARQSDDLAFYRSIVSPEDGIQGLRIQRFEVARGAAAREYVLRLTLVQAMRHESIVAGLAQVTLSGQQDGKPRDYTVGELLGKPRAQLPFSFRYFQTLEQVVTLPQGFEPFETRVRVQSSKLRGTPVEQSFAWQATGADPG